MSLFSIFSHKEQDDGLMPIGAALDLLENVSRRFPYLVLEWIEANPARAQKIEGLVDKAICKKFKGWNGPYSITIGHGDGNSRVVNMFFQNLRRDIKVMHEAITKAGEDENRNVSVIIESYRNGTSKDDISLSRGLPIAKVNEVIEAYEAGAFDDIYPRTDNDDAVPRSKVDEDLQMLSLLATMSVTSGKLLDQFPSLLNTESIYDSKSIILAGMVEYYSIVKSIVGEKVLPFKELCTVVDGKREKERSLNSKGFVPYNFNEVAMNLIENMAPRMKTLFERAERFKMDAYKVVALDVAGWVVYTLTNGKAAANERNECERYFANLMISSIAWEMCGVQH